MAAVALAFFAGILTVTAPCSLPVLPALLGVSLGQRDKARPAFITMGFVVSFTAAAIFFSVTTQIAGIDQTALRTTRIKVFARHSRRLQQGFGAAMIVFAVATYFDHDALIAAWLSRFYPGGQIGL
jgi:cytochrome c biogenesis protein CcdA